MIINPKRQYWAITFCVEEMLFYALAVALQFFAKLDPLLITVLLLYAVVPLNLLVELAQRFIKQYASNVPEDALLEFCWKWLSFIGGIAIWWLINFRLIQLLDIPTSPIHIYVLIFTFPLWAMFIPMGFSK
ncbi:hypothetical protein ICN48_10585 [Polynucleobacter sp. JS-Safj-400b-B2]|uniref:hypothetical protein n=1 Tax=Polynucleobacter sp. JS-Safj-400b-B2 TaxID=2576921 RepID=UPI001C0BB8B1|nr:hypothetical protein [Polynucleobacter sp. JS-Safj-400b-B2]MBU3626676.1 hypothetical protein [Polynucleobacter sp. JS-Safj-400b-B2]